MVLDSLKRPARSLRLSVTDRCNLRCQYCMPEAHYTWLPHPDILRVDELDRLARAFTHVGVDRVRLTGASRSCAQTFQTSSSDSRRIPAFATSR